MSLVQRSEVSIRVTKKIVSGAEKRSFHSSDQEELEEMNVEQHHRGPARHGTALHCREGRDAGAGTDGFHALLLLDH